MKKNIGIMDRIFRLIIGVFLLVLSWWTASWLLLLVSVFVIYEAAASWCLFYQLIGKSTCPIHPKNGDQTQNKK